MESLAKLFKPFNRVVVPLSIYISVWSSFQVRGDLYPISVYNDLAQVDDNPDYFVEPLEGNLLDEAYVLIYFDQFTEIIMQDPKLRFPGRQRD